jgi:prophage regulatory protein
MAEAHFVERVRFISYTQTEERTNLSERTISRKVAAKEFPQPIPISQGRKAFIESEVDAWINEQVALARGPSAEQDDPAGEDAKVADIAPKLRGRSRVAAASVAPVLKSVASPAARRRSGRPPGRRTQATDAR